MAKEKTKTVQEGEKDAASADPLLSTAKPSIEAATMMNVSRQDDSLKAGIDRYNGKRVIYFINGNGNKPQHAEEIKQAYQKYKGAKVLIRNALMVRADEFIDDAEVYAGAVPEAYMLSPKCKDRLEPSGDYSPVLAHRVHPINERPTLQQAQAAMDRGEEIARISDTQREGNDQSFRYGEPVLHGSAARMAPAVTDQRHVKADFVGVSREDYEALPVENPGATLSTQGLRDRWNTPAASIARPADTKTIASDGKSGSQANGGENLNPDGQGGA
jgi:hypothetical protein